MKERHHLIDPTPAAPPSGDLLRVTVVASSSRRSGGAREVVFLAGEQAAAAEAVPVLVTTDGRTVSPGALHESRPDLLDLARASGLTAYALLTLSVLAGLVVKSKPFGKVVRRPTVTDLHRFLALLGLGAVAHPRITLVLDTTVKVTLDGLVVPGLVPYRPLWTALGVLAAELMVLIYSRSASASGSASRTGGAALRDLRVFARRPSTGSPPAPTRRDRGRSGSTSPRSARSAPRRRGVCADRRARPAHPVARFPATTCPRHRNANWRYLEMTIYRITIDRSLCSGFGSCVELAPEAYELGPDGIANALVHETDDPNVVEAAGTCPMGAITVEAVDDEAAA